ncbi:hypothetical protein EV175_006648 [Coemansia sp. RSA 1933]|nr:hypothetical protein EV175_006648 [Coemansia sp. RSA 1933]
MGASNSKEERVYIYADQIPLGFTPQLNEVLVKASAKPAKQQPADSSEHTKKLSDNAADYSRDLVDEEVAKELARILEKNQLDELQSKARQASSAEILNEIRDITHQINASPSAKSPAFEQSLHARDRVSSCLVDNADTPLNCWKEVSDFKALVATLESEFVAASK